MDLLDKHASPDYAFQCIEWCLREDDIEALGEHMKLHSDRLSDMKDKIEKLLFDAVAGTKPEGLRTLLLYTDDSVMARQHSNGMKCLADRLLCQGIDKGHAAIVDNLLQRGANVNSCYYGKPILHLAVTSGNLDVAETLLEHGADLQSKDVKGNNILHTVIVSQTENQADTVRWLLGKGLNIQEKSATGKYPLHLAAGNSAAVCSLLLQHGCDVNIIDDVKGDTPLHIACALSCQEVICKLVQYGAKFNKLNRSGQTPLFELLKYAQGHNDFHSRTRMCIARTLIEIGFRMPHPKDNNTAVSRTHNKKGRNKIYDRYLSLLERRKSVPSLQSLSRFVVMNTISSGVKVGQCVEEMDIPINLRKYLLFKDTESLQLTHSPL